MDRKKPPISLVPPVPTGSSPARKLGSAGQTLWDSITSEYRVDDAGGIETLHQLCAAKDRIEECMVQIETDGCIIFTKNGPKSHPLLANELALRSFICRSLVRLGLNVETIRPVGRPPAGGWSGNG
jgi:hypothetical protein